ncbi:hypothetical protein BASA81_002627 [Batrachochytrium salamandrivorans]|nr:hypothetical protein BASA81_002627 [Batrachochytrium salamandrivorans]
MLTPLVLDSEETKPFETVLKQSFVPDFPALLAAYAAADERSLASFAFSDVVLLPEQTKKQRKRNPNPTPVLQSCFGHSKPREALTILGPDAKTQHELLRVLAGKKHSVNRLRLGEFHANGVEEELFPMVRSGLVVSAPQHLKTSTVQEEFEFACALRMRAGNKKDVVQELLQALNLSQKAQTQIKFLTPHELRRVALGVELASLPNLLLVDQPFTGHRMADWEMARILRALAGLNLFQVVVAAHAPRPEVYQQLSSHVLLLSARGETLSIGTGAEAVKYLASKGRHNTENLGEGDFLLLCAQYAKETWPTKLEPVGKEHGVIPKKQFVHAPIAKPINGFGVQFSWLFARELKYVWREIKWLLARMALLAVLMGVVALFFQHAADQHLPKYNFAAVMGSFVFPILFLGVSTAVSTSIVLFGYKQVVVREQHTGEAYSIITAMLVKSLTFAVLSFSVASEVLLILYYVVGWNSQFIQLLAALYVILESVNSYSFMFAFACKMFGKVMLLTIVNTGLQLMFLGAAARYAMMPTWISWVGYVCNMTWGFKLLVATELNPTLCISQANCYLWDMLKESNWTSSDDIWKYYVILLSFFVFYRVWGVYCLYQVVDKQR